MNVAITPTDYSYNTAGCLSLFLKDGGASVQVSFHPALYSDALDRLDSLIDAAIALRAEYRLKVEAEAAEMAAEEDDVDLQSRAASAMLTALNEQAA